jgi:transposase
MQKRTKYTAEFREEAVKLALSSELSSAMISKELGINKNTLYNWISNSMQEKTNSTKSSNNNINAKYKALEKEKEASPVLTYAANLYTMSSTLSQSLTHDSLR